MPYKIIDVKEHYRSRPRRKTSAEKAQTGHRRARKRRRRQQDQVF